MKSREPWRNKINVERFFFRLDRRETPPSIELHAHSSYTDGADSPARMAEAAMRKGLSTLGFAEHLNSASTYWDDFRKDLTILRCRLEGRIEILSGIEVRVKDFQGHLDVPESSIREADYVVGVVHSYTPLEARPVGDAIGPEKAAEIEFEALKGLIILGNCDIVGHMGGTYQVCYPGRKFPRAYRRELMRLAKIYDVAIEYNSRYHHPIHEWIQDLARSGVKVSLGSDAHSHDQVGRAYKSLLQALKT